MTKDRNLAAAPALVASLFFAAPAAAQGVCQTYDACLKQARAAVALRAETKFPADCSNKATGCVVVDGIGEASLPATAAFQAFDLNGKSVNTLSNPAPQPISLGKLVGLQGIKGATVAVRFYMPPAPPTSRQALFTLSENAGNEQIPRVALGMDREGLVFGKSGKAAQMFWLPLWDPTLPPSGWYTLFLHLQADGKTRTDLFRPDARYPTGAEWNSGLIDPGWPMPSYPAGHAAKIYSPIGDISLGTPGANFIGGFSKIIVFNRELSRLETRAILLGEMAAPQLKFERADYPCNTGGYLNQREGVSSYVDTPCGSKNSVLAIQAGGAGRFKMRGTSGDDYYWTTSPFRASDAYLSYRSLIPPEQTFSFEHMGNNYYYIYADMYGLAMTVEGEDVHLRNKVAGAANQYWRIDNQNDRKGYWNFRSAATGYTIKANDWLMLLRTPKSLFPFAPGWARELNEDGPKDSDFSRIPILDRDPDE